VVTERRHSLPCEVSAGFRRTCAVPSMRTRPPKRAQGIHRRMVNFRQRKVAGTWEILKCPGSAIPFAAFQVSIAGWFWVSLEDKIEEHLAPRPNRSGCILAAIWT
jgi:hypothetical protein